MANTMTFNGQELTLEQIQAKMKEFEDLKKLQKAAKSAGLITAAAKKEVEKPAEFALVKAFLDPAITTNLDVIAKLFEVMSGQDSVSINITNKYDGIS